MLERETPNKGQTVVAVLETVAQERRGGQSHRSHVGHHQRANRKGGLACRHGHRNAVGREAEGKLLVLLLKLLVVLRSELLLLLLRRWV